MQGQDINGEISNDQSGTSVSLSADGTFVAVGAPYNNGNGSDSGHVRVYKLISNTWTKQGGDIDGEDDNDKSGSSVSLSRDGSIVAIGSPKNNNSNGTDAGNVRVFKYNANKTTANSLGPVGWDQLGGDINGENSTNESGTSVSISDDGTIVAIGSPKNNNSNGTDSGQVRVYKYNANKTTANSLGPAGWDKQGGDIDGENSDDESGTSVSISGDGLIVAIGGPKNNGIGTDAGHVRVYKLISNKWIKQDGDIDGEAPTDESGRSVSISRDGLIVAIGAPNNNSNESGHVRVYKYMLSA